MSYCEPTSPTAPARKRSPWIAVAAAVVCVTLGTLASACSAGSTSSTGAPVAEVTTAAAAPACSTVFKLGAAVTAADATVVCTNRLGLVSRSHSMSCRDGRTIIFDRDANVYGFPGGHFATSDTDANSQYAKDFSTCLG